MTANKIFLGGTCNESTWRSELAPLLKVDFFDPVVDDWTPKCQRIEEDEKKFNCNIHLYVITVEMTGVFSIAEAIESAMTEGKVCLFHVIPDGFSESQLRSLLAVCDMVKKHRGYAWIDQDIADTAGTINLHYGQ